MGFGWTITIFTASVIGVGYLIPKNLIIRGLKYLYPSVLFNKKKSSRGKKVYLTIDDVPYNYNHEEILNTLQNHNAKATFFVINDFIDKSPENREFLIRAIKDGYHLANHGRDDCVHILKDNGDLGLDIWRCSNTIDGLYTEAEIPVPKDKFYRPGGGYFNSRMIRLSENNGHVLTLGSVYPWDPYIPFSWLNYLYIISKVEDGDIIIIHDRFWSIDLLDRLLPWLQKNGFECLSLVD